MVLTYTPLSVTLRDPDLSDNWENTFGNIVRRLRNGELISFRPTNRTTRVKFRCNTSTNKKTVITAFETLLNTAQADTITLDIYDLSYSIIIVQDSITIITKKDVCSFNIQFDFQIIEVLT